MLAWIQTPAQAIQTMTQRSVDRSCNLASIFIFIYFENTTRPKSLQQSERWERVNVQVRRHYPHHQPWTHGGHHVRHDGSGGARHFRHRLQRSARDERVGGEGVAFPGATGCPQKVEARRRASDPELLEMHAPAECVRRCAPFSGNARNVQVQMPSLYHRSVVGLSRQPW